MTILSYSAVILGCVGALACKDTKAKTDSGTTGYRDQGSKSYAETDFSEWMSKAGQQVAYDALPAGTYFVYSEGRNNGGFNQYRHVKAAFPKDKFSEWGVFWGLSPSEFYELELKMIKSGFVRQNLQVFTDSQGLAMHQAVWMKPLPAADKPVAK